jgi:hypothetical protein
MFHLFYNYFFHHAKAIPNGSFILIKHYDTSAALVTWQCIYEERDRVSWEERGFHLDETQDAYVPIQNMMWHFW